MFPTYLLFPPHRPRERLAAAFVDVLRGLHDEIVAEAKVTKKGRGRAGASSD
jgi:hypothetical protein